MAADSKQGFTVLEVMVALAVGGIAIGSLYAVGSASTRQMREQQRISAAQTSLRAAMDQVKRDLQRAGFLGTPLSTVAGEVCAAPTGVDGQNILGAIAGYTKKATAPTQLDPGGLNTLPTDFFTVDQLWLTGNFTTTGEYPNITIGGDGVTVSAPMNWQTFRRDFTEWGGATAGTCNYAAFETAFPVGRMVRLHAMNGNALYSRVTRTTCTGTDNATISVTDNIPNVCNMNGGWISPLNTIRYWVDNATAAEDSTGQVAMLRRQEVQPGSRTQLLMSSAGTPIDDRALLNYVVKFNVDFIMRDNTRMMNFVPATAAEWRANPERVRGAIIDIAVRTAQQDSVYVSGVPESAFRLFGQTGAARVRRARAELLLPNLANRGL
jgi:prepilin-type N-terminal cleavage/methylation domain-containing protein